MKDEQLYYNEWISLRKISDPEHGIGGYVYSTETRCSGRIVTVLPFRVIEAGKDVEFLLKNELTPCWGMLPKLSTITGGFEGDAQEDAIREVLEETGYKIAPNELIALGQSYGTKSCDTVYDIFSVDLTDKDQGEAKGDGSGLEGIQDSKWVRRKQVLACMDPMASVALARLEEIEYGYGES